MATQHTLTPSFVLSPAFYIDLTDRWVPVRTYRTYLGELSFYPFPPSNPCLFKTQKLPLVCSFKDKGTRRWGRQGQGVSFKGTKGLAELMFRLVFMARSCKQLFILRFCEKHTQKLQKIHRCRHRQFMLVHLRDNSMRFSNSEIDTVNSPNTVTFLT